jgi:hypothetical protein
MRKESTLYHNTLLAQGGQKDKVQKKGRKNRKEKKERKTINTENLKLLSPIKSDQKPSRDLKIITTVDPGIPKFV